MEINRQKITGIFHAYVNQYDMTDTKIRLKAEHTLRVADLCDKIAQNIGLPADEVQLAWLLGMLHDIGRFEQVRRYQTFVDQISIDHAGFGADLLFQEQLIRGYITDVSQDDLIEKAVRYHSIFRLPELFTERERMFCDILRDADKIDILKVNIDIPLEECYNATTKEVRCSGITPEVYAQFLEGHTIPRMLKKTVADQIVGHISLVFELVYPISRRIVKEQGYLAQLLEFPSENEDTRRKFVEIRGYMKDFTTA